jgi:poly(hydroxyalkanoate) granule-associated protein
MAIEQIKSQAKKVQNDVTTSAHQVFLAGLGAAALVEQESGKLLQESEKLFGKLVARGRKVEADGRKKLAEGKKQVVAARKKTEQKVERFQGEVSGQLNSQLTKLVQRLGIPHQDQIQTLSDRVAELTRKIDAMQKSAAHN